MNREQAVRKIFFDILTGKLIRSDISQIIGVFDGQADTSKVYVIFDRQTARFSGDFRNQVWDATFEMNIVHKQEFSYTKDIIDDICIQVEDIILPGNAAQNGLGTVSGWNINTVSLDYIDYSDFRISSTETMCVKNLTFNFKIQKT